MDIENKTAAAVSAGDNVCRVCLARKQNNQCILGTTQSNPNERHIIDLAEKFRLCSGIEILEDDGLPSTVCARCICKINDAHELRKQCQDSDIRLRELYGQVGKIYSINLLKNTQDQYCQTDYSFTFDLIKVETGASSAMGYSTYPLINLDCNIENMKDSKVGCIEEEKEREEDSNSNLHEHTASVKFVQTGCEKSIIGRETSRTRRMTMFKRVTSIENLKNHKERQRQYIKKNGNVKWDDDLTYKKETGPQSSYICSKCNRCYSSKRSLDRHLLTHNDKKFICEKCNKYFFQFDKLVQHRELHTSKVKCKPVSCNICNRNFRKTDTMVRHLNIHKKSNPKEVLSILKEIRDKRKLDNVMKPEDGVSDIKSSVDKVDTREKHAASENTSVDSHGEDILDCEEKESHSTLSSLDGNTKTVGDCESRNRCKYCSKCYANEESLEKHLQNHIEKKFVCHVCNMKFFRQDRLISHKNRYGHNVDSALIDVHKPSDEKSAIKLINTWIREELDSDNEEKGFPCKICGKSYDTKKSLLKHQSSTHNAEEEDCTYCGKMCKCDDKEKDQQKSNDLLKPYQCDACNKSFEKEVKLQKHMRIHERAKEQQDVNFKRFLCHICSKTFRQNTGLMFHMRTHTGYKPHVCKYCGRGFTSNSNCINHERTHTGDRPFVCHFCSAAFAKSCTLKAHITTHTGEANYHCKTCGKSFRRLKYLKEHKFTHTGEKPYACKICGTAYSHSGSLFVHEKKCKAQYNNYQSNTTQNARNYCESETSSPSVTPSITILPHVNDTVAMDMESNRAYVDNTQKMNHQNIGNVNNVNASDVYILPDTDMSDVSLAVKSFALIGQMFQS